MLSQDQANAYLVELERLRSVFQNAPLTHAVAILNAVIIAISLAPVDGVGLVSAWVFAIAAVSLIRLFYARAFLRHHDTKADTCRRWAVFSVLGALAAGVLWGVGATALFPASTSHQLLLALVIGGMCAGSLTVGAAHLPTVMAFILPASLPLAASLFIQGPTWRLSALMVIIFASALSLIGLSAHRTFGDRVRLQFALDRERSRLSEVNGRLLTEVTQRRTAEATLHQAQKMEAIGHLTGGIAHDFNNLLQVVIGNMHLIRRLSAGNPRVVKYAEAAEQAAMRGAKLTGSLLTFARRQTLETEPIDVNALLREFEPILLRTIGPMIQFEVILEPTLPECLADAAHFQSAILNLVINARDAMPDGGILSVTTSEVALEAADLVGNPDAKPGRFVSVSVRDTGVGLSPELIDRVFEPFFTTKDIGKGTGLGLSQVYGFARQSRGHVRLVSAPNEGAVVTLWLPVYAITSATGAIPGHAAAESSAATTLSNGANPDRGHAPQFR